MKHDEVFIQHLQLLSPMIIAQSIQAVKDFQQPPYVQRPREARRSYAEYRDDLTAQVFSEVKASIVGQLELTINNPLKSLVLRKGSLSKNGNIRFFCEAKELTPGKYALLLEHLDTHERHFFVADYDGRKIFQVPFKTNPDAAMLVDVAGNYRAYPLLGLTPFLRSFIATQQAETPLLMAIAGGAVDQYFRDGDLAQVDPQFLIDLNDSQQQVLAAFTQLDQGLAMLMGPPGTGKTTTIARILAALCAQPVEQGLKKIILVCGPSNKSVQVVAAAFHKKFPHIRVALYARESALDPSTRDALAAILVTEQQASLQDADVVCMTLSASGSKLVTKALKGRVGAVIIDEVGQAGEPETLTPLALNPEKVLIVGDVHQLPPTVLSTNSEVMHYQWSMLWRLIIECQQRHFLLDTQYRMHPDISEFPREVFYDSKVHDGVTAAERVRADVVPYEVIDVEGVEEIDVVTKSYRNLKEAQQVVVLVRFMLTKGYQLSDIAIITPYKAQAELVKQLLRQHGISPDAMHINTVDSFQGEESPVVFVSLVRANQRARIGFLSKYQRLNVAITRPREVLRILMNGQLFNPLQPRSEFESDFMQVLQQFGSIPLPEEEDAQSTFSGLSSRHGHAYSAVGYRRSLDDYEEALWRHIDDECGIELFDENGKERTFFQGPEPVARYIEMLNHFEGRYSSCMGKFPIFFLPFIPKGTHVVQDILNRIKVWRGLSFAGLPDDLFMPIRYKSYYKSQDEVEDYGNPFDENDNYCPSGYGIAYCDDQDEELEQKDLVFENHVFFNCDLQGVNFHDSEFKLTRFDGSDVRGCQVNLEKMDVLSKFSFLRALAENRHTEQVLPTDRLVVDAIQRGVYREAEATGSSPALFQPHQPAAAARAASQYQPALPSERQYAQRS